MSATFQNSAMVLSIGIFFSLIILGLSASLPSHLFAGLTAQGVPAAAASSVSHLPPTAIMFAALLGYNPIQMLLGSTLTKLPASHAAYLTGHSFFPSLISAPFQSGLDIAFDFAIAACLIAAVASLLRGKRYVHELHSQDALAQVVAGQPAPVAPVAEAPARDRVAIAEDLDSVVERTAASPVPATRHRTAAVTRTPVPHPSTGLGAPAPRPTTSGGDPAPNAQGPPAATQPTGLPRPRPLSDRPPTPLHVSNSPQTTGPFDPATPASR